MSKVRVYFKPRNTAGVLQDWIEVTEDVELKSMGKSSILLDNDEFNVGLFKFNDFSLKLRNDHGLYSDVNEISSIFRFRRGGSPVKITWDVNIDPPICGVAIAGEDFLGDEVDILKGVLSDESSGINADNQQITFKLLTTESIFSTVETPHASISVSDLYSDTIFTVLNQSAITELLTVSAGNITVDLDLAMDVVTEFENTTVKEALDKLLFQSNSVLYVENDTVFVKPRDGETVTSKTFYGHGSNLGVEDIVDITNLSTGLKNVFNYWTWRDTTLLSQDVTSVSNLGIRKKEIEFDEITNTTKRQQVLDAQRVEFANKKKELNLETFISYDNLNIGLLDRVNIDFPSVSHPTASGTLPLYGAATYGTSEYPIPEQSINIDVSENFKVIGKTINFKKQTLIFKLKEQ